MDTILILLLRLRIVSFLTWAKLVLLLLTRYLFLLCRVPLRPLDGGQTDQRNMDVRPQSDDDSLSPTSTLDIKGEDSHDADDDDGDNAAVDVIKDPDVAIAHKHYEVLALTTALCGSVANLLAPDCSIWPWLFPSLLMMMKLRIRRIFAWYQSIVHPSSSVRRSPSQLLVGYDHSCLFPTVFPCLLGIIRHRLWIARNAYQLDGSQVVYTSLLASVKSSLRFVVRIEQCHCPRDLFVTWWLAGGILGYVSDENIIVFHCDYQ